MTHVDQGDTRIVVERTAPGAPAAYFAVLADPRRHVEIDGSGTVRAAAGSQVVTGVGQVFTMEMTHASLGEYRTENHVVDFEPGHLIAWMTAREGLPPAGVRWSWELDPAGDGGTRIVHTYDWSRVVDPAVLARVSFPRVPADALRDTVARLVAAVEA